MEQVRLSSSILAWFSCIFQCKFFPHAMSRSTGSCRPPISRHGCSVPGAELLAGPDSQPLAFFPGWKHSPAFSITATPSPPSAAFFHRHCILPGVWYHLDSSYLRDRDLLINSGSLCWDRAQNTGAGGWVSVCRTGLLHCWSFGFFPHDISVDVMMNPACFSTG